MDLPILSNFSLYRLQVSRTLKTSKAVRLAHQENFKKPRSCLGIPGVVRTLSI